MSIEKIQLYRPGGCHQAHLGDTTYVSYVIEHKLGFGDRSTGWLARDLRLKLIAAAEEGYADIEFVCHIRPPLPTRASGWQWLWRLWEREQPQASFFRILLDQFTIYGTNGSHRCIVTEVLGPSIGSLIVVTNRLCFR